MRLRRGEERGDVHRAAGVVVGPTARARFGRPSVATPEPHDEGELCLCGGRTREVRQIARGVSSVKPPLKLGDQFSGLIDASITLKAKKKKVVTRMFYH
jgi:hypothetical protein